MAGFDDDRRHDPPPPTAPMTRLRAWLRPASEAFAEVFSDAELEQERRLWELDRLIGAVDGETWVGTGGAYSLGLTVPGGEVGAAGITVIGVTPSHRRRGILRMMMRWLLDQARERSEPIASPVRVRERHLPAVRVRDRDAPEPVRHRAHASRLPAAGSAARPDPAGRSSTRRPGSSRRSSTPSVSGRRAR